MTTALERITTAISDQELARRWQAARKEMSGRKIDALVMQNANDWLGGYVKWFTDIPATNGYPKTVIFHTADPMTVIEMGGFGVVRKLKGTDPIHRGIDEVIGAPSFLAVNYTDNYHADCALSVLRARGYRTIGLLVPAACRMPSSRGSRRACPAQPSRTRPTSSIASRRSRARRRSA
jgi:hypothetical protein